MVKNDVLALFFMVAALVILIGVIAGLAVGAFLTSMTWICPCFPVSAACAAGIWVGTGVVFLVVPDPRLIKT
jgi:hypothetical protein